MATLRNLRSRLWSLAGRVSILIKIMGIVLLVVGALAASYIWFARDKAASSLAQELATRGIAIGNGLATHTADLILTDSLFEVYRAVQNALRSDPDVSYVYIENNEGRVLIHTFSGGFPVDLLRPDLIKGNTIQAMNLETEEGRFVHVAVPILQGEVGWVHAGLSTVSISAAITQQTRFIFFLSLLVLLPGLLLAYILVAVITRALRAVVNAAHAVGQGDFTHQAPIWAEDEIGHMASAFNQMTEQLKLSHQQLLRRHRELSLLYADAQSVSRSVTVEDVLQGSLQRLCELMEIEQGRICLAGSNKGLISFIYQDGSQPAIVRESLNRELAACPCREIISSMPYILGPFTQGCPMQHGKPQNMDRRTTLCIPLRAKERLLGMVHLARQKDTPFKAEDLQLLTGVTEQLSVAVENARLWEDLQERDKMKSHLLDKVISAQEEERRRVSQELHDEAGQALTSLLVELRSLEFAKDREALTAKVAELRALVADSLRSIQNIALELRPSMLDDVGLVAALRRYIEAYALRYSLEVDFEPSGLEGHQLQPSVETAVYRIIQEALINVARHAEAHIVNIVLTVRNKNLVAIVEDNGRGFQVDQAMSHIEASLGIQGMQERASLVGGRLTIESEPGSGTTVFLEVPLTGNLIAARDHG